MPRTRWYAPMYGMIPVLQSVALNGEEAPSDYTLVPVLNNAVPCIPQRAGLYITRVHPTQVVPSVGPMLSFREWEDLTDRPGWRFRILHSNSTEFKGRQIGFGADPLWTAAIVIHTPAAETQDGMQVDPSRSASSTPDFDTWLPHADPFLCAVDNAGTPLERSLLAAFYRQDVGVNAEGKLSPQNLDQWTQYLPEVVVGDKIDLKQLQMVYLKVTKELIDELMKLRQELNQVRGQ